MLLMKKWNTVEMKNIDLSKILYEYFIKIVLENTIKIICQ